MLQSISSVRERVTAYYDLVASIIERSFAHTPLVYAAFPNGFTHPPSWHSAVEGPVPPGAQTVSVELKHGTSRYFALTAEIVRTLSAHPKGAIEFHGWGCVPADPHRARFAHILLEHDAPPAPLALQNSDLVDGALLLRDQLAEVKIQAIPIVAGRNAIALWIPLGGGPQYPDVRSWLHAICNEAAHRHPQRFTCEANTHRDGRVHLHVSSNAPGRYSALPYSLRGNDELLVCTPVTWKELPQMYDYVTAETLPQRLEKVGDLFASQVESIALQQLPHDNRPT